MLFLHTNFTESYQLAQNRIISLRPATTVSYSRAAMKAWALALLSNLCLTYNKQSFTDHKGGAPLLSAESFRPFKTDLCDLLIATSNLGYVSVPEQVVALAGMTSAWSALSTLFDVTNKAGA